VKPLLIIAAVLLLAGSAFADTFRVHYSIRGPSGNQGRGPQGNQGRNPPAPPGQSNKPPAPPGQNK